MGWFWAENVTRKNNTGVPSAKDLPPSACPVSGRSDGPGCPVVHSGKGKGKEKETDSFPVNPLNNMPTFISAKKQAGQKLDLPTDRSTSSIPRGGEGAVNWEYPSPQQMYNAMVRKGKIDPNTGEEIPEDAVESMVFVHNFLNEGCWEEVLNWEQPYTDKTHVVPRLLKFTGRPDQLSPRARWYAMLGKVFPSYFSGELPFDRHDWVVLRADPMSGDPENPGFKKVRYVIDFYGGPDDEDGFPTFNLDVRPALDNASNAKDRFIHYTRPIMQEYFGESKDSSK